MTTDPMVAVGDALVVHDREEGLRGAWHAHVPETSDRLDPEPNLRTKYNDFNHPPRQACKELVQRAALRALSLH